MSTRVAVVGAGVIGQVFAALLHQAGHEVYLMARGQRLEQLQSHGVRMRREDRQDKSCTVTVPVRSLDSPPTVDVVLLTVRAQQLDSAMKVISGMGQPLVVPMMHLADQLDYLEKTLGVERLVLAFPGMGGFREGSGRIVWAAVRQQPTTVDALAPAARRVRELLASTGLRTSLEPHMRDWLNVHSIFVACLSTAVLVAGGDPVRVANDPRIVPEMVAAIRSGLAGYQHQGGRIRPRALAAMFGWMPAWFAVAYWKREFKGPVGRITIAPHSRDSQADEAPVIGREAMRVAGPTAVDLGHWLMGDNQ